MSKVAQVSGLDQKKKGGIGRIIKWLLILLIGIPLVLVGLLFGSIAADAVFGKSATDFTNVTYAHSDGTTLHGYLAEPPEAGDYPGIIMGHEWWGLNEDITLMADALAEEGYVVLVPSAYREKSTGWVPHALFLTITSDQDRIEGDFDAGFDYLQSLSSVNEDSTGMIGFCFGGRQALWMGMREQEMDSIVSLYGGAFTEEAELADLDKELPILTIWGETDASIPVEEVQAMLDVMDDLGLNHESTIYPDLGHAFVNSENYDDETIGSGQAWDQIVAFFDDTLKE